MISVVIVSFHSGHLLFDRLKEIGTKVPVIIVDNSKDEELKKELESKYSNVKVLLPEENFGFGKAFNHGMQLAETKYIYLMQPDVILHDNCIDKLIDCVSKFEDFAIISPININQKEFKNYEIYTKKENNFVDNTYGLEEVDQVDVSWLINKSQLTEVGNWDENIFLYFETYDLCKRLRKKNMKIYISKEIKTLHMGGKSHNPKFEFQSLLNRNWHYNWSKFYYFNKHYNYLFALKKTLPNLLRAIKQYIKHKIFFKKDEKYKLHYAAILGLLSSYLKRPSNYRPYEKN